MARKVCIDGSLMAPRYRGVGAYRYLTNLLGELDLASRDGAQMEVHVLVPSLAAIEGGPFKSRSDFKFVPYTLMRAQPLWKFSQMFMLAANRLKADALFLPFPYPIYFKTARLAITVHDLIPLIFPDQFKSARGRMLQHCFRTSLARADLILTVSEHSKADMTSRFGVPPERVVVAYEGFDRELFKPRLAGRSATETALRQRSIDQPYVLHVGRLEPRKNLVRLVESYRALRERRKDLDFQLALCGPAGPGSEELFQLLHEPELQGRVLALGAVPDRDLAALYQGALCCAMPSLYEGFGLPVLEAMASGCPVMSSNRSCLPEIAGDGALYFDPESVEEMSAAMERLLTDSALREQMVERGLARARRFSWEACARTTLAALKNL